MEGDDLGPFECLLRSLTPNRSVSALEGGLASLGWKGQSLHVPSPQKDALGLECGARESDQSSVSSCAKDDFNTIGVCLESSWSMEWHKVSYSLNRGQTYLYVEHTNISNYVCFQA